MKTRVLSLFLVGLLIVGMVAGFRDCCEKSYKIGAAVYGLKAEYMRLWTTALERHRRL
jgi:hypothetical protein